MVQWFNGTIGVVWCIMRTVISWIFILSYVLMQDPVANLPQGRIVGIKVYTENSLNPVEIFFGVPYANAPTGRYRFSAPERHPGWRRTFFAHRMPPRCPQAGDDIKGENYSEDCLYLNIWTTRRSDGKSMPVAVILYSDSWERSGVTLPCQELAAEGIVVVTVSYRLHLLAFFTLRSLAARGNLALLDQYLAFLWVRDNIAAFGGDPSAIVLIGHSAGADSVLHHIVSPRVAGLFQRVIIMSPRDIWKAVDESKSVNSSEVEQLSRKMARALGCTSNIDQEILHCMRDAPLADIVALYSNANWSKALQLIPDDFLPTSEQYLPISLATALSASNQPTMQLDLLFGITDLEDIDHNNDYYKEQLKRPPSYIVEYANTKKIPELLKLFALDQPNAVPLLTHAIRWEYWGAKGRRDVERGTFDSVEGLARMESSAKWGVGSALLAARLARRISRLYVYRYLQPGRVDLRGNHLNFTGAVHGVDLIALLGEALTLQVARQPSTPDQKRMTLLFRQFIVNFIKFGSPSSDINWKRYKVGDAYVHGIHIDENYTSNINNANRDATFWLQYLQQLNSYFSSSMHTEQLTLQNDDYRLRGGMFAMCGVSAVLVLLLLASAVLLHRERRYRSSVADEMHN